MTLRPGQYGREIDSRFVRYILIEGPAEPDAHNRYRWRVRTVGQPRPTTVLAQNLESRFSDVTTEVVEEALARLGTHGVRPNYRRKRGKDV